MIALAFDLAGVWRTTPDHYLAKPVSELLQDQVDTVAHLERTKRAAPAA